jgi:hypothetical protein
VITLITLHVAEVVEDLRLATPVVGLPIAL